jgi:hypothetical protein
MKLAALAIILLLIPNINGVNRQDQSGSAKPAQVKNADLQTFEDQLKQIDEQADSVTVRMMGENKISGYLNITGEQEVKSTATANSPDENNVSKSKKQKVTLLNYNLSTLNITDEYIDQKIFEAFSKSDSGTLPGVKVRQIGATKNYEVVEDYTYKSGAYSITVPKGFIYDRASIPRVFWVLIDKDSLSNVAPLFHDLLYRSGGVLPTNQVSPYRKFSREEADDLFLELMAKSGVNKWRREAAYQAVRRGAALAWKGH